MIGCGQLDTKGLGIASGVLGLVPSLPLASLVVVASVSFWENDDLHVYLVVLSRGPRI